MRFYSCLYCVFFFFFNDTATTEIYTLSLHDALPIWFGRGVCRDAHGRCGCGQRSEEHTSELQSHSFISYAVFCLKKKKKHTKQPTCTQPHWCYSACCG